MPYIEGAMDHVKEIYRWNEEVDMMRVAKIEKDRMRFFDSREIHDSVSYHWEVGYDFNAWLRLLYEERWEYTTGKLEDNLLDQVDALIDQFVVAVGEIRKCALADDYEHIAFWEDKATKAYRWMTENIYGYSVKAGSNIWFTMLDELINKCLTEVISKLFTRLGWDSYIDENGKFKKRSDFQEPDLSFLLK